jgi:hypothetical protein
MVVMVFFIIYMHTVALRLKRPIATAISKNVIGAGKTAREL